MQNVKQNIGLDTARKLIKEFGGYGTTRVYATFLNGVYKGQIDSVKAESQLDELVTAYTVQLWCVSTSLEDLISKA